MNIVNPGLSLPQLTIYGEKYRQAPWLLFTGGRAPTSDWIKKLPPAGKVFAADHGLDCCRENNIIPDYILGDGDSAAPDTWNWGKSLGVPVEEFPVAKDLTDTQLALTKMKKAPLILITGAFGGRFDHLYSLIFSCARENIPCVLCDEQEFVCFVKDSEQLTCSFNQRPQAISLLPCSQSCTGVTINNVRWPLTAASLTQLSPTAISNELLPDKSNLTLTVGQGILGLYCHWGD